MTAVLTPLVNSSDGEWVVVFSANHSSTPYFEKFKLIKFELCVACFVLIYEHQLRLEEISAHCNERRQRRGLRERMKKRKEKARIRAKVKTCFGEKRSVEEFHELNVFLTSSSSSSASSQVALYFSIALCRRHCSFLCRGLSTEKALKYHHPQLGLFSFLF